MRIFAGLGLLVFAAAALAASPLEIADYSDPDWQVKEFEGLTAYTQNADGTLSAEANSTASGLVWQQTIDLTKTPFLNWRWRVNQRPAVNDEREKKGDDFAARVYLIVDGGFFKWRSKALNYVWSATQPTGSQWDSPYAPKNIKMLAVAGQSSALNQWQQQKRNVRADFSALFGKDITSVDAIAVMSDADNSQSVSRASFGRLFFSEN